MASISTPNYQRAISELLSQPVPGRVPFSVEFMPPRDDAAEARLWDAALTFHDLGASFVSITYGAGGGTRERTARVAERLAAHPLTTLVHMTLVEHTRGELEAMLRRYAAAGLSNLLALRGDPPGDALARWKPTPGGLQYASELVDLVRSLPECRYFDIGVAAFPEGHPRAESLESDTRYTVAKLRAGAQYCITQMFFDVDDYLRLRDRVAAVDPEQGAKPLIPGIMPVTSIQSLHRQVALSGSTMPMDLLEAMQRAEREAGSAEQAKKNARAIGIEFSTRMADLLIAEGVPDLHFMTMNYARATQEVLHNLGMAPAWGKGLGHDAVR